MDHSIYERSNSTRKGQTSAISFGRITAVYPDERMCEVKTFFGNAGTDDTYIPKCQWINMDANPEGDESSSIPRTGSTGLVFWVEGEPFIFGYFRALNRAGSAATESAETLTEGDKIISTVGGNAIRILSNGVIEIQSSQTLRTIYFPKDSLLNHLCSNYQFLTNGGLINWLTNDSNETLNLTEYRRDVARTAIIVEERGRVDPTIVKRVRIGPGVPGVSGVQVPVYEETVKITGETVLKIGPPTGFTATILPTGAFNVKVGPTQFEADVAATGETTIKVGATQFKATITPTGALDVNIGTTLFKLSVAATGALNVKVGTTQFALDVTPTGNTKIAVNSVATLEITPTGDYAFKGPLVSFEGKANGEAFMKSGLNEFKITPTGDLILANLTNIKLGGEVLADFVATANKVMLELTKIIGIFNAHTHTVPPHTPVNPTPTTPPIPIMPPAVSTASSRVQVTP